jgi:hypothetical protein
MTVWHTAMPFVIALTAGGILGLAAMVVARRWLWLRHAARRGGEAERDAAYLAESILALDAAEHDAWDHVTTELATLRPPLAVLVRTTRELDQASERLPPPLRRRAHAARQSAHAVAQGLARLESMAINSPG